MTRCELQKQAPDLGCQYFPNLLPGTRNVDTDCAVVCGVRADRMGMFMLGIPAVCPRVSPLGQIAPLCAHKVIISLYQPSLNHYKKGIKALKLIADKMPV